MFNFTIDIYIQLWDYNISMHILPNTNNVTIQKEKFTDYILDPIKSRGKWIAFRDALGYTKSNVDLLIQNIYEQLLNYPAEYKGDKGYGKTYAVHLILTGENGKTAYVLLLGLMISRPAK